jgi:hypothetical protein
MEVAGKDLKPKDAKLLGEQIQLMRHYLLGALRDEPDAHEQLTALLARFQLNLDDIAAIAFQVHMTKQIEIEDVAGAARERRDSAYAELEKLHERRRQQRQIISSVGSTAELPSIKAESSLVPAQSIEAAEASSAGPRTAEEP